MKKTIVLSALIAAATTLSIAQSNTKGTIHVGLGFSTVLGGAKITTNLQEVDRDGTSFGARFNVGARIQYSFIEALSAGLYVRSESASYLSSMEDNLSNSYDRTFKSNGLGIGAELKFYLVNKDKFLMYVAPSIGYASASDEDRIQDYYYSYYYTSGDLVNKGTSSGMEYGMTFGFNWYWTKYIGMSLDVGFNRVSMKGDFDKLSSKNSEYQPKGLGFLFGLGLVSKFGGN